MALYSIIKGIVDDFIYSNGIQAITGDIHNSVEHDLIDAVGAAQVYAFPALTDDPGTPENPRAYIALPGTYTYFGGLSITAPLGVLKWDGTSWTATQLTIPSAYEYRKCKTTQVRTQGTPYTSVTVSMLNGGWEAKAGTWVQLIDRRTGSYEFIQLTADITGASTSLTFKSWTFQNTIGTESIVEIWPTSNMEMCGLKVGCNGTDNYITVPSDWRLPPEATTDTNTWKSLITVLVNKTEANFDATPASELEFRVEDDFPLRIYFGAIPDLFSEVIVRYNQPRIRTIAA